MDSEKNEIQQWKCVEHICQDQQKGSRLPSDGTGCIYYYSDKSVKEHIMIPF